MEKETRIVVAASIGSRTRESVKGLWKRLLKIWKNNSKFYTGFWKSYQKFIPKNQYEAVGKETGKPSLIVRVAWRTHND
ncbi:MAG: hypothetical protein NW237_13020 [Cyanobacteriota bacterium]|nr:hypothetical protein [Cyanobacteriota bacterium]